MSKQVEARFRCVDVHQKSESEARQVAFAPVIASNDPNDPNKMWAKATPAGLIQMTIDNPTASSVFEVGKTYSVMFDEVPEGSYTH